MQQSSDDGGHIHAQAREDEGHLHRMGHVGIAGQPHLPLVDFGRIHVCLAHQVEIAIGVI